MSLRIEYGEELREEKLSHIPSTGNIGKNFTSLFWWYYLGLEKFLYHLFII